MEFGGPQVLRLMDVPVPAPAAGDVVVRVAASTVNPSDVMMRAGQQASLMTDLTPPYIAGMEFGGHVDRVGEGVSGLALGQPVTRVLGQSELIAGAPAAVRVIALNSRGERPLEGAAVRISFRKVVAELRHRMSNDCYGASRTQ